MFSVFLYGEGSFTLTEKTSKQIKSFEVWLCRTMLRVTSIDYLARQYFTSDIILYGYKLS